MEAFLCMAWLARRVASAISAQPDGRLRTVDFKSLIETAATATSEDLEAMIRMELDASYTAFDDEVQALSMEFSDVGTAASRYRQGLKGEPPPPTQAEDGLVGLPTGEATASGAPRFPKARPDPYLEDQLKEAIVAVYRRATDLTAYKMASHESAKQLLRTITPETRALQVRLVISSHPLFTSNSVRTIVEESEHLYAALFCEGSIEVARTSLTRKASRRLTDTLTFGLGLRLGVALLLLAWTFWDCLVDDPLGTNVFRDPAFKIFRGLGCLILTFWLSGAVILIWHLGGIDYIRILEMDPSVSTRERCNLIWTHACNISIFYLVAFLCFYKSLRGAFFHHLPSHFTHVVPIALYIGGIVWYVRHFDPRLTQTRAYLRNTVLAPFAAVTFRDALVGDFLTSLVRVSADLVFGVIYALYWLTGLITWRRSDLSIDPTANSIIFQKGIISLVTYLPLWLRLAQNLRKAWETRDRYPHYANGFKYASALSVSIYAFYNPSLRHDGAWVFVFFATTTYQFYWDVSMDWSLIVWDSEGLRVRKKLLFKRKQLYFVVMVVDLALRFFWMLTLLPEDRPTIFGRDVQLRLSPILAAAEIARRFMWAVLRLENEHLDMYNTNVGRRRAMLQVEQPDEAPRDIQEKARLMSADEEEDNNNNDDDGRSEVVRLLEVHPAMAVPVSAEESAKRSKRDLIQLDGLVLSTREAALSNRPERKVLLKEGAVFLALQCAVIVSAMAQ